LQVDLDTSSSSAANYITGMVRGATKSLVVDLSFVLEGTTVAELPETLIGAVRFKNLDLATFTTLQSDKEIPMVASIPSRWGCAWLVVLVAAGGLCAGRRLRVHDS
jgi:hypothetical protein